ncbi:radiation-inducible immediate-early gene IEX-1 [Clupea harengus]|uniref:Radiation-inducible immediate-early gene IEX-1 n=1 Tax=Clupea harengus TaxID=7950 RepID=A0A6P3W0E1_CLUHA|nr:radiation-inducible immediate-early gene IEX-1 [Clupea harengus]
MYTRSDSIVLSLPTNNFLQDSFSFSSMPRSKEPEIFTFDHIPAQVQHRPAAVTRQRRKNTRVMYPSNVRKYLPPVEKSAAKRWLVILCLVVFLQIWTEEGVIDTQTDGAVSDSACEETTFAQYQVLPFQSAEEQARQMRSISVESQVNEQERVSSEQNSWSLLLNTTCPSCTEEIKCSPEQSTSHGYVVALLYPVYHTLGSDN